MRWCSLFVSLAACGFEPGTFSARDPDAGVTTSDGDVDGAVVDVDAFVDTDTDGDEVGDSVDNCPSVPNMDQRNHDGDPRGDACDRCPHLDTGASDPDSDGDLIGDSCDPRPSTPGDTLVLWDGYYDNSQRAGWTDSGTWTVANGFLTQADPATNQLYTASPFAVGRHAVTAGVRVDALGTPSGQTVPAVSVAGGSAGATQFYVCGAYQTATPAVYGLSAWPANNNMVTGAYNEMPWPVTLAAGTVLQLSSAILGANHRCSGAQGTQNATVMQNHGPTQGLVLLLTQRIAASFDYVHVVAVGN